MTLRRLGLAVLGVVVVGLLGLTADWGAVGRGAANLVHSPLPLLAALVAYTLAFVLRSAAWGPLLPAPVALGLRFRAILAMLAVNHALPGPVGEVARARLVSGAAAVTGAVVPFRGALLSVAAARVVDVGALAILAMAAAAFAGEAPEWVRLAAPAAAVLPLAAWVVARRRGAALTAGQAVRVAAWAVPSWVLEAGVILVVARAAGVELSPAAALLATCGGVLAQAAAVLPGGVGTYEAGVASVLVPLGVPLGEAVGVAATAHGVKFAYAFLAGGLALAWPRLAGAGANRFSVALRPQGGRQPSENARAAAAAGQAVDVRP